MQLVIKSKKYKSRAVNDQFNCLVYLLAYDLFVIVYSQDMLIQASTGTYKVSKGQLLVGNIHLAHRDPDVFPEPNTFKPFRFYENPVKKYCLKNRAQK